jgi:cardiolipin synthase
VSPTSKPAHAGRRGRLPAGRRGIFALCLAACAGFAAEPPLRILTEDGQMDAASSRDAIEVLARGLPEPARFERLLRREEAFSGEPLVAGNDVELLVDGPETYAAMLEAIAAAEHHIHLETYILDDDEVGQQLADALIERRGAGVDVKLIYDAFGAIDCCEAYFERLRGAGVELVEFHPVNPVEDVRVWRVNERDHRKLLIIDGRVGFTGGINFSSTYSSSSAARPGEDRGLDTGWRDTHVRIEGPAVAQLQQLFLTVWHRHSEEEPDRVAESRFFPEPREVGDTYVRMLSSRGSDDEPSDIYRGYLNAIEQAQDRVWITQAYFAPNDRLIDALGDAAGREVDVRIIVPGFTDLWLIFYASRAHYADLLERGVRLYEMPGALLHAKTAVVDGVWSTVGSSNLDTRSRLHNLEANAVMLGHSFGARMEALFEEDVAETREITADEWRERSLWERFKEWIATRFDYWL